jgi:hypothetical protein
MEFGVSGGIRTEGEDFEVLRNRIIECICHKLLSNNLTTFHGVDMIKDCAKAFLDERGVDQYQFSGEHEFYRHVLERIYRPLAEIGLIEECENNNYRIPDGSRLRDICRRELQGREYIVWDRINWERR